MRTTRPPTSSNGTAGPDSKNKHPQAPEREPAPSILKEKADGLKQPYAGRGYIRSGLDEADIPMGAVRQVRAKK